MFKQTNKSNSLEAEAKLLYENMLRIVEKLVEFESELTRQKALSEQLPILNKQHADFDAVKKQFIRQVPLFSDSINKTKEFCATSYHDPSKLRDDLINCSNEANFKFKMVYFNKFKLGWYLIKLKF